MAISSYPRTIKNGQIAPNGDANAGTGLMLYNSTTGLYEAATTQTFSNISTGLATSENQTTQINSVINGTNSGVLLDQIFKLTLNATLATLPAGTCKSVTLINLSTNNNIIYKFDDFNQPDELILEAGYSVKLNVISSDYIQVKQQVDNGQILQYIVTT